MELNLTNEDYCRMRKKKVFRSFFFWVCWIQVNLDLITLNLKHTQWIDLHLIGFVYGFMIGVNAP